MDELNPGQRLSPVHLVDVVEDLADKVDCSSGTGRIFAVACKFEDEARVHPVVEVDFMASQQLPEGREAFEIFYDVYGVCDSTTIVNTEFGAFDLSRQN